MVEDPDTNKEMWTRLFFEPEIPIEESFYAPYVNKKEADIKYKFVPEKNKLSNYLDISFDAEISKEVICRTRAEQKKKNIFTDLVVDCSEQEQFAPKDKVGNIYDLLEDDSGVIC